MVQGEPSGRLLSYNPATGKTHVVAQEFWFANGVALSKDEDFIAVVETNTQTVHRVWLTGAKVVYLLDQMLLLLPGAKIIHCPHCLLFL